MSSLPSPEGVAAVVELLDKVAALGAEAHELRPKAKRLQEVEGELHALRQRLPELLRSMDVESPGNNGWERRMGWFLAEMRRQLLTTTKKHICVSCGHDVAAHNDADGSCSDRTCTCRLAR